MNPGDVILNGPMLASVPLALLAGLISFLSPCVLPLIPGYLGFIAGMSASRSRILIGTLLFVLGFSAVFVSFGALFGGLGSIFLAANSLWLDPVLGILVILMGLVMLGQFTFFQRTLKFQVSPNLGLLGAPLLGIAFGIGWTPCIGPTLAAVLTLAADISDPSRGAILAFSYALGIGIPFMILAAGFGWATKSISFVKRHIRAFNITGGTILITLGLLMATGVWKSFTAWLQWEVFGYFQLAI